MSGLNDFNIYYLNFSKVYEMAMIINNQIVKSRQVESGITREKGYSDNIGLDLSLGNDFFSSVKSSMSSEHSDKYTTNTKVVESIEVQTTKADLLRRILPFCKGETDSLEDTEEGELLKLDKVQLRLLDEESLRQFLILKRNALQGFKVEGMELNNIISSLLQDYSYVLIGELDNKEKILIKIPMESQAEFENKYKVDDILIGKVSIVGIFKGKVTEDTITANTFSFFQEKEVKTKTRDRVIRSNYQEKCPVSYVEVKEEKYNYIDVLAIIQDVKFMEKNIQIKMHWWNKFGIWLSKIGRKNEQK